MERVRTLGFEIANTFFTTEAAASSFVLKEQGRVVRTVGNQPTNNEIKEAWLEVKNDYASIPEDMIKSWELASHLIR